MICNNLLIYKLINIEFTFIKWVVENVRNLVRLLVAIVHLLVILADADFPLSVGGNK